MSEEHWCAACWLTKRTDYYESEQRWLCDACIDKIVTAQIDDLIKRGIIVK